MMTKRSILFFVLLLYSPALFAQNNIAFKQLNLESGLSQSSVLSIGQDGKGFLWFGTRFGLNKYDSRTIKTYINEKDKPGSLSSSYFLASILTTKSGNIWVGSSRGVSIYNEQGDDFEWILHDPKNQASLSSDKVNCLFQDSKKRIWIGASDGLNLLDSEKDRSFKRFLTNPALKVWAIAEDHWGRIWVGTNSGLLCITINNNKATFKQYPDFNGKMNQAVDNRVTTLVEDRENNLWIGTKQTGLSKLNLLSEKFTTLSYSDKNQVGIVSNNIRKIIIDAQGKLWIGTLHGINVYDPATQKLAILQNMPGDMASLSQNSVYDIFQDKQGIIWIGTYFGGVNMVYPNHTPFRIYSSKPNNKGLSGRVISAITEDSQNNLWIGTEGEGVNYFDRQTNTYRHYLFSPNNPNSVGSNLIKAILKDKKGRIWVGTHLGGLNLFNPASESFTRYKSKKGDSTSISSDEITSLFEDSKGRFWVGTNGGLNIFDPATGKFGRNQVNGNTDPIAFIYEDSRNSIWLATTNDLYQLTRNSRAFIPKKINNQEVFAGSGASCILEDRKGNFWIGTIRNGIYKVDAKGNSYLHFSQTGGLPSNNIVGLLEDDQDNLWISTDNGLAKYNPKENSFRIYNVKDGLPSNEFNYHSSLKDSRGEFYFGTLSGLISFFPGQIKENKAAPKVIFTGLKLFNKPVEIDSENKLLPQNISIAPSITFESRQNVFSIDFAILNFIKPEKNRYAYKLEGFEKNWNYVETPTATYTNLSPGNYVLLAKGCNNDGIWSTEVSRLLIEVRPPFYKTWWAYLFYLIVICAVVFIVLRYLFIRALLAKEKETGQSRLNFFTNISHEIRTPLTLILGPLDKLLNETQSDYGLNKQLLVVKNNTDRLMRLVTELLDFRKAEAGKMRLHVGPENMVSFCNEIYLAFKNMAESRNIDYIFKCQETEISIYFDKAQIEKVLFNLLSNAFKFTKDGGKIVLEIVNEPNKVNISVTDTGKGISATDQANIFTNFYQADEPNNIGTGIGLAFSKSIVELHHGQIKVLSLEQAGGGKKTCFGFYLLKGTAHFNAAELLQHQATPENETYYPQQEAHLHATEVASKKGKKLLIADDNMEIRKFIIHLFQQDYQILEASSGLEAWQICSQKLPDLVISDVMMPGMDGFELCHKLKTDDRTSHIPVILLTARAAYIHQINGLETGADAYITKPFDVNLLRLNVRNLIASRTLLQKKYAQLLSLSPQIPEPIGLDQVFLKKLIHILEENIGDSDFSIPKLSAIIGISQAVLYKKIRAVTGVSVNEFIKAMRLKRAAQLLKQGELNIKEIAYAVGFSDRKYFSNEFKREFGKTPTEFIQETDDSEPGPSHEA